MDVLKCFHVGALCCSREKHRDVSFFNYSLVFACIRRRKVSPERNVPFRSSISGLSDHQRTFSGAIHMLSRKALPKTPTWIRQIWMIYQMKHNYPFARCEKNLHHFLSDFSAYLEPRLFRLINAQFIKWTCWLALILFSHLRNWILIDRAPSISLPH